MNNGKSPTLMVLAVFLLTLVSESAFGQAFCALRDPVRRVYELFPEADSYRSIIGTVGPEHRKSLDDNLSFQHHFNEFGRHTLYVPLRKGVPLGLIHVRSERGRWGLVEICWALDLDLKVKGFEFQRCRDPESSNLITSDFAKTLVDADLDTLTSYMESDDYLRSLPESQQPLAETVLRSGLKTVVLTESVWQAELNQLRAIIQARASFGDKAVLKKQQRERQVSSEAGFDIEFMGEWEVTNGEGENLGTIMLTGTDVPGFAGDLWWAIGPEGNLIEVTAQKSWMDERTEQAFAALKGRRISEFKDCATAVELAAEAVLNRQDEP